MKVSASSLPPFHILPCLPCHPHPTRGAVACIQLLSLRSQRHWHKFDNDFLSRLIRLKNMSGRLGRRTDRQRQGQKQRQRGRDRCRETEIETETEIAV